MTAAAARRKLSPAREAAYRKLAGGYAADPVGYAREVLGATLTPQQVAMPDLLATPPYRLLVPSANKVGKTWAAGWLINHFHDSFDPGVCLATSATYLSVKTQLFKEVRKSRPFALGLKPRAPEIFHHDQHQVVGFSTKNPDAFQGQHEGQWFLLFDEATAVPQEICDRAETMFSGVPGHRWVCFYNPNDPTTWPYAAEQGGGWHVHRLSALDHPNLAAELRGDDPPFPGAVRLHRVEERIAKECEDCGQTPDGDDCFLWPPHPSPHSRFGTPRWWKPVRPEFNPQVRGRWPKSATNSVWGEADWGRCLTPPLIDPAWPLQLGCDVARFGGNRTTIAVRWGVALVHLEAHTHWPTRRVSYHIAERLRELASYFGRLAGVPPRSVPCCVDDSGGYGSGVVDYPDGFRFVRVVAAETAWTQEHYPNKRSELWFTTRLAADEGGFQVGACRDAALVEELGRELRSARYSLDRKNRRVVEGKDAIKERLRASPDLADGVNLAWCPVEVAA